MLADKVGWNSRQGSMKPKKISLTKVIELLSNISKR
jgi:hypothetical protein